MQMVGGGGEGVTLVKFSGLLWWTLLNIISCYDNINHISWNVGGRGWSVDSYNAKSKTSFTLSCTLFPLFFFLYHSGIHSIALVFSCSPFCFLSHSFHRLRGWLTHGSACHPCPPPHLSCTDSAFWMPVSWDTTRFCPLLPGAAPDLLSLWMPEC